MKKLLRHKWVKQNGFRVHQCFHCGVTRMWDDDWKQLVYRAGSYFSLVPPSCKRIMHCDLITKN